MIIKKSTSIKETLTFGKDCEKCGHCCSYGSGVLLDDDITKIAEFLRVPENELKEKYLEEIEKFNTKRFRPKTLKKEGRPYGQCIFLGEDKLCQVHEVKPAECRIGNCNEHGENLSVWFSLNYFVDSDDPESIRQWAQYLETHPTIIGGTLTELVPDRERLGKMLNYSEFRRK